MKMIEELAKDYASYVKIDVTSQIKNVHETIEDMMARLEEFESIIGMVQTIGAECTSGHRPRLQSIRPELSNLCKRIDALEHLVARVSVDLTALETAMDSAEAELGGVGVSDRLMETQEYRRSIIRKDGIQFCTTYDLQDRGFFYIGISPNMKDALFHIVSTFQ